MKAIGIIQNYSIQFKEKKDIILSYILSPYTYVPLESLNYGYNMPR